MEEKKIAKLGKGLFAWGSNGHGWGKANQEGICSRKF
jgi:hypothetical protein